MATTDKLAPRIIINENDILPRDNLGWRHPITLLFGFSPTGRTCEMVKCDTANDILQEFGFPTSAPEKYFIDSALRLVQQNATVLMTRLPYDNPQSHTVKYVDYKVENAISMRDIATVPSETKMREKDDGAVTILKEMHDLDSRMTQVQRISQKEDEFGQKIGQMTNEKLVELELDPQENLDENTFRIVDIKGEQYGTGAAKTEYAGIFPIITTAAMALYFQSKIENSTDLDKTFALMDFDEGIEMSTTWWKGADPVDDEVK